jgi:beta-lactamase class A
MGFWRMLIGSLILTLMTAKSAHASLEVSVDQTVAHVLEKFPGLRSNQLAMTVIDLTEPEKTQTAAYRGSVPIYPASVVKLFYLAAAHRWMEDGRIQDTEELRRAMRDMIVESYNEATHYVLDVITGTTGGPELPDEEMKAWEHKRNAVNRYFASLGFTNLNVNQKPWCEGPYGRERVFVGKSLENRNALTTDATARLLAEIAQGRCVSKTRSQQMLELLKRDPLKKGGEDDQGSDFIGAALPKGAKLWSKAGWTSTTRHDAAYVELPTGKRVVLVIFTTGHSREKAIIPTVAARVFERLGSDAVR